MIDTELAVRRLENLVRRLGRVILAELPTWQLLVLAATVGLFWAASLFDWSFVAGRSAFWQFPKGIISGSEYDMAQVLVGYLYYVQSPWHLPLFAVSALGTPAGTNVIFLDVVPIVALAGKMVHSLTGATINLYGAYLFLCFSLPGVMMTLVLIAAKTRCALAAVTSAIFADTMPALLWRWGHIALEAQFLAIGALALYLSSLQKGRWRAVAAAWIGFLALAYLTNVYLFAMVGAVWLCAVVQRRLDRLATTRQALAFGALTVAVVIIVIALGGQFSRGGGLPFAEYGIYSMNVASPFVPQASGVYPAMHGIIDATGGQYEGFNYLGLGLLWASIFAVPAEAGWLRRNARRHAAFLIACSALTAFAISHRVFIGQWLILALPIPPYLNSLLGIFRSNGRFFWLIGYTQIAVVVVLAFRRPRLGIALSLLGAAILQICDVQLLRQHIVGSIVAGAGAEELDHNAVARLVAGARRIEVVPSFQCSGNIRQISANMQLMLAAARADVPTNTVYLARQSYDLSLGDVLRAPSDVAQMLQQRRSRYCEEEIEHARRGSGSGEVLVLLSDQPRQQQMPLRITCSRVSWAQYCRQLRE